MTWAFWLLAALAPGDELALRESVRLGGRFVRLADLIEPSAANEAARAELAGVYLGRVPEAGRSRTVTAGEIRRQLEFLGLDPARFRFSREEVVVRGPGEAEARPAAPAPRAARPGAAVRSRSVVRALSPDFEVDARALEDGAPGDEILLEFVPTRHRFRGRVVDAGSVDVIEGKR